MNRTITDKDQFLKEIFWYSQFRHWQDQIIDSLVEKKEDNLVIIPTWGWKSLIYQIAGSVLRNRKQSGITLVISPLISLMKDQVKELNQRWMHWVELSSHNTASVADMEKIRKWDVDFVFVSPEKLASESFQEFIKTLEINLFVIDEAHCATMWWHQFRPEYGKIWEILKALDKWAPTIWLTATANQKSLEEVKKSIFPSSKNVNVHIWGYYRDNFDIQVKTDLWVNGLSKQIEEYMEAWKSGIIYFQTVKELQQYSEGIFGDLVKNGIAWVYHWKWEKWDREDTQDRFLSGHHKLLLATTAFGMGVNKSDIDFVIHNGYPSSVESYYQEIWRAGRDWRDVEATLYRQNLQIQKFFIEMAYLTSEAFLRVLKFVDTFSEQFSLWGGKYSDNLKIKDFKSLAEKSLWKDYYATAIYSCAYKFNLVRKNEDGVAIVDIKQLKNLIKTPSIFAELDKIKEYKLKQADDMDAFFSNTSKESIKRLAENAGDWTNFLSSLNLTTYINILDFFWDTEWIKKLIEDKSGQFDIWNIWYAEYFDIKTILTRLWRKDLLWELTEKYFEKNKKADKKNELFLFWDDEFDEVVTEPKVVDKKKMLSDWLWLF